MPGKNRDILSTAVLPADLLAEARKKNLVITAMAFVETEPVQSVEVQQEIEAAMVQSATVVFTSQNAVAAVAEHLEGQQPDWNIYCVGQKTSRLAASHFGEDRIIALADNAASLANLLLEDGSMDEVYFFCGGQRLDDLPDMLERQDIRVNEIVVYQTIPVPRKLENRYEAILFFSPSAVDSFFRVNKAGSNTVFFATGPTTASAVKRYVTANIITCRKTGKEEMIRELVAYFNP